MSLRVERSKDVVVVTIDRPERRNAVDAVTAAIAGRWCNTPAQNCAAASLKPSGLAGS